MPASKALQQEAMLVKRLTGSNDVKASEKSIYKTIRNHEWNNEKDFSDSDLDRYLILLEGEEYESDQVLVRWKVFKISHNSVMVVRTYMAWALDKLNCYSCGDGILYTMNANYHSNLCDLLQDLIDLNWYHKLHFPVPVKESRTMATSKILGTFYNPENLVLYATVSIDNNFIIRCRLKNDRVIRYRTMYIAQQCLEDLAQSTLRFATL